MAQLLVEEQGIMLSEILAGTGLATRLLTEPAQWLTPEQELLLYTRIAHCNNDPALGIRVGQRLTLPNYGVLGAALMAAYTLAETLELLAEFAPLVSWASHSQVSVETYEGQPCTCLSIFPTAADPQARVLEIDSTFASLKVLLDELLGEPVPIALLDMDRQCSQEELITHRTLLDCPVRTGRPRNALLINQEVLARPLPHPQPGNRGLFRDLCHQSTSALTEKRGLVAAVRSRLQVEEGVAPSLELVAEQFNLSSRTLRRQLRAAGVTFQSLLDESRYREARRSLESTGLSVEVIARRLGYADARSFRAAFRRWSGQTPADFRNALIAVD
ncbi:MAG: AraC family transcriptional regulator ligand-binding domain-containing protein [Halioglobus sp.]